MKDKRILVTGAGGPAGINTIKLLRDSYYIVSTDINEYSEGFVLSDKYYIIPSANDKNFINTLEDITEKENIDLVILTVDEEIYRISEDNFKYIDRTIIHPKETVRICKSKYILYSYLKDKIPELIPDFSKNPKDINSDIIVKKPEIGRGSRDIYIGKKEEFKGEEGFFFVEYLPGNEWTVDIVTDKNGKIIVAIPRIRLKTRSGVSQIGYIKLDKRIINYVNEITRYLKFNGGLNIQFKEDKSGNPKLQEINLRFSGGLDLTAKAGVNLPKILVEYWLYNKYPEKIDIKEGIYVKIPEVYYWKNDIS